MKKLLSGILVLALLMSVMTAAVFNVTAISKIFPDTANDAWYSDAVRYVADSGIMKGYADGNFGTADGIQRQDFLVMLARYAGVNLEDYSNVHGQFPDVAENSYYEAAVNWGYEKGIVTGYQNGYFGVSDLINREQIVTFLYRYAKYKELNVNISYSAAESIVNQYTDFRNVSEYAQKPVLWAINRGVISGKNPTTIFPEGTAQRCEIAQIMYNIYRNDIFNPDKIFEGSESDLENMPLLPEVPVVPPTIPGDAENPYGYINAWGTIAQMEADMAAYVQSLGYQYDYSLNLDNSCWSESSIYSGFWNTSEEVRAESIEEVKFETSDWAPHRPNLRVRVIFITQENVANHSSNLEYVSYFKGKIYDENGFRVQVLIM